MARPPSSEPHRPDGPRTRELKTPHELQALASPVRLDLLACLRTQGAASVAELALRLDRAPSALYHHIAVLVEAGLVQTAGERGSGRRREQLWALVAARLHAATRGLKPAQRQGMGKVAGALLRHAGRAYERALADTATVLDGPQREAALRLLALRLDEAALARFNAELDALVQRWSEHEDPAGTRLLRLAIVLAPATRSAGPPAPAERPPPAPRRADC